MPLVNLIDVIVALLHHVLAHVTTNVVTMVADANVVQPLLCHRWLLPLQTLGFWRAPHPLPLIGQPAYLLMMEPSDHDASPRCHQGCSCVIHGWGSCPNPLALAVESSSWGHEGEEVGEEDEEESR
jgi:hypothetical protein